MRVKMMVVAFAAVGLSTWVAPVVAQHEGHQMPGTPAPANANVGACAENAKTVSGALEQINARVEDARQSNDPAKLRTALGNLQIALTQIKTQLAECTTLAQAGSTMGNMAGMDHSRIPIVPGAPVVQPGSTSPAPAQAAGAAAMAGMDHSKMTGMDHSKMPMAPKPPSSGASAKGVKPVPPAAGMDHSKMAGAPSTKTNPAKPSTMAGMDHSKMTEEKSPAAGATPSNAVQATALVFTVRTDPAPPRNGKNDFEVTVKDPDGKPIADAEVSMEFYMPPMPAMKMPEMRTNAKLTAAGNGVYRGVGTIGTAGAWDVIITVTRNQQILGTKKLKVTAR